jgi:hypothetical protein
MAKNEDYLTESIMGANGEISLLLLIKVASHHISNIDIIPQITPNTRHRLGCHNT